MRVRVVRCVAVCFGLHKVYGVDKWNKWKSFIRYIRVISRERLHALIRVPLIL